MVTNDGRQAVADAIKTGISGNWQMALYSSGPAFDPTNTPGDYGIITGFVEGTYQSVTVASGPSGDTDNMILTFAPLTFTGDIAQAYPLSIKGVVLLSSDDADLYTATDFPVPIILPASGSTITVSGTYDEGQHA